MRIGHGYDVHRLVEGRRLILGGVEVPFDKGLLGHSDADVLTHAVMDALLGAAALGDIGRQVHHGIHFLISIHQFVRLEFFSVVSVDAVVGKKPHVTLSLIHI